MEQTTEKTNGSVTVTTISDTQSLLLEITSRTNKKVGSGRNITIKSAILSPAMAVQVSKNIHNVVEGIDGPGPHSPMRFADTNEAQTIGVYGLLGGDSICISIGSLVAPGKIRWVEMPCKICDAVRLASALVFAESRPAASSETLLYRLEYPMTDIGMEQRKERLIELLTKLAKIEPAIYSKCSQEAVGPEHDKVLVELEGEYPELGLHKHANGKFRVTFPSLLATVTDILCGERICFNLDDDAQTEGFGWWHDRRLASWASITCGSLEEDYEICTACNTPEGDGGCARCKIIARRKQLGVKEGQCTNCGGPLPHGEKIGICRSCAEAQWGDK